MANYDGVPADENNSEDGTSSKAPFDYKKWANFRLSETCLGDLFRRLDIDGNGVLELIEFVNIVKKLKFDCPPSLLAEIFARADADGNGHMTLDEFIMAYNLLYDSIPLLAAPAVTDDGDSPEKCFIWAVRYGYDALLEEFCYDVFKGGLDCMYEKISHFEDGTARVYDLKRGGNTPLKPTAKGAGSGFLKTNSFDFLADMMRRDAGENRDHGGNVMWWVDVSYKQHVTSELIRAFKLDKNLEPKMYIHQLEETSARIVPGNLDNTNNANGGEERMGGSSTATKSLTFQLQAQWIENLPVMNIVSEISASWPTFIQNIVKYFGVRLPLLKTLAFAHHRRRERAAPPHIDVAKLISDETMGIDNPCVGTSGDGPDVKKRGSLDYNANEANSKARPSDRYVLLGESVLKQHPADFKTDLLTMHAVDFGDGSHTMISYHRWFEGESAVSAAPPSTSSMDLAALRVALENKFDGDDDAAAKAAKTGKAKEEANRARYACAGAMGRILQAVRAQLRCVIIRKGVTGENSELADSTGALMALIIEKLHIFNEKCLDNTEEWLDCVKHDLHDNFAGRKHLMHLHEIKLIVLKMMHYAKPFDREFRRITQPNDPFTKLVSRFLKSKSTSNVWIPLWKGCVVRQKRGSVELLNRIDKCMTKIKEGEALYATTLTTQYVSMLQYMAVFCILVWPAIFLAKYYSMNFDDMTELASSSGVTDFWGYLIMIASLSWILLFHFHLLE